MSHETHEKDQLEKETMEPVEDIVTEDETAGESVEDEANEQAEAVDPLQEAENRYIRLLADFDNHKKRTAKEREDIYKYANQSLMKDLLPVLDAFDLALQSLPNEKDEHLKSFSEGTQNIHRQLKDVLGKAGLERIEAEGKPYDPVYHEAVMMVPDTDADPGTIVDELRAGYQYKDRVLRPTVCRVSE